MPKMACLRLGFETFLFYDVLWTFHPLNLGGMGVQGVSSMAGSFGRVDGLT